MPSARSPVQEVVNLTKEIIFRQIVAKKRYRIIYQIKEIKKDVVVLRVVHVRRDTDFVKKALL
jgi:plasmid stabilization system protein ParE